MLVTQKLEYKDPVVTKAFKYTSVKSTGFSEKCMLHGRVEILFSHMIYGPKIVGTSKSWGCDVMYK